MIRLACSYVLLQFLFLPVLRAENQLPISRLGIQQGLSNNSVRSIYQDHKGFMWFGTYDGLNRYDGYRFTVFRNILNDSSSIPHNYIYAIHEDPQHNLWVGTGQGLVSYNNLSSTFSPTYFIGSSSGTRQRISFNVTGIGSDQQGNLFIGTNGWGLLIRKKRSNAATQVSLTGIPGERTGYNVQALRVDRQQRIWLFVLDLGLCEYEPGTGAIRIINNTIKSANCMETDEKGNLWIGTNNGLYRYHISSAVMTAHFEEGPTFLSANRITSLCFDKDDHLWVGTEGGGISVMDTVAGSFSHIIPGEDRNNISSESVFALFRDKENRMWIGTIKGGINIMDVQKSRFKIISSKPFFNNSLVNNFTSSFFEDINDHLWIGTDGGGISVWNREKGKFTNYVHRAGDAGSLSNNSVSCITGDSRVLFG